MFLWTMVWCIIFAPGGFSMLISKLSHARPAERFLFLMIWLGTRVLVLRSVSSIQRSICLIVLSLAQWPKRFSKKTIVLLPVKDFMVKPSDIHFPGINFRPEQAKRGWTPFCRIWFLCRTLHITIACKESYGNILDLGISILPSSLFSTANVSSSSFCSKCKISSLNFLHIAILIENLTPY